MSDFNRVVINITGADIVIETSASGVVTVNGDVVEPYRRSNDPESSADAGTAPTTQESGNV